MPSPADPIGPHIDYIRLDPLRVALRRQISLHSQITRERAEFYLAENMEMRLWLWSWTPDKPARVPVRIQVPSGQCQVSSHTIAQDIKISLSWGWLWDLFKALWRGEKTWNIAGALIHVPAHTHTRWPFTIEAETEISKVAFPTWATQHVDAEKPVLIPILSDISYADLVRGGKGNDE